MRLVADASRLIQVKDDATDLATVEIVNDEGRAKKQKSRTTQELIFCKRGRFWVSLKASVCVYWRNS
jgi:hypothetical protein